MDDRTRFALDARMPDEVLDLEALTIGVAGIQRPAPWGAAAALDALARRVEDEVQPGAAPDILARQLRNAFVRTLGFNGDDRVWADPDASFLDRVLETKTGLPILLSVVWIRLAARLGVPLVGVGYPGHFLVALQLDGARIYLDPYHGGAEMEPANLIARLGLGADRSVLEASPPRAIVARMLGNLRHLWEGAGDHVRALDALERSQLLVGERPVDVRDRGLLLLHLERLSEAKRELQRYIQLLPAAADRDQVERLLQRIARSMP